MNAATFATVVLCAVLVLGFPCRELVVERLATMDTAVVDAEFDPDTEEP